MLLGLTVLPSQLIGVVPVVALAAAAGLVITTTATITVAVLVGVFFRDRAAWVVNGLAVAMDWVVAPGALRALRVQKLVQLAVGALAAVAAAAAGARLVVFLTRARAVRAVKQLMIVVFRIRCPTAALFMGVPSGI